MQIMHNNVKHMKNGQGRRKLKRRLGDMAVAVEYSINLFYYMYFNYNEPYELVTD